jgi:phosphoribosylformylglycinamidine synthase PurS subunit
LSDLGFAAQDVAVGKLLELKVAAQSLEAARVEVRRMAAELLVNPVLEDYELEIEPQ